MNGPWNLHLTYTVPHDGIIANREGRIRHKKCDEAKPACSQCSNTGRRCDFLSPSNQHSARSISARVCIATLVRMDNVQSALSMGAKVVQRVPPTQVSPAEHLRQLSPVDAGLFDFFRFICAPEFSLYFQSPLWRGFVFQAVQTEPWAFYAALAISALSREHYTPGHSVNVRGLSAKSFFDYATIRYNQAIRCLNKRIERAVESAELAVLGSILFVTIEFLQQTHSTHQFSGRTASPNYILTHIQGGVAILRNLATSSGKLSHNAQHMNVALEVLKYQLEQFYGFQKSREDKIQ